MREALGSRANPAIPFLPSDVLQGVIAIATPPHILANDREATAIGGDPRAWQGLIARHSRRVWVSLLAGGASRIWPMSWCRRHGPG